MDNNEFKPYIPAEKELPEFTVTAVVLGVILAVVFGARRCRHCASLSPGAHHALFSVLLSHRSVLCRSVLL